MAAHDLSIFDGSDPLTPVERLFMEAGYSRTFYLLWRMTTLSSLKIASRLARLTSGWPSEAFDDDAEELKLAKQWLERESRRAAADKDKGTAEKKAVASAGESGPRYGPLMTTSEVQALIQEEIEAGSPVSLKAFENALRRAAKTAREHPERRLSAKLSARGAALSTAAILLRDVGHAFKVWDRVVINIGPAAKD